MDETTNPELRDAVASALNAPWHFEPLRRALTPDDRIAVVIDEEMPGLGSALAAVLDHLESAAVPAESVTIVSPKLIGQQAWIDDLPDEFADVKTETHHPTERKRLAYLANTSGEERIMMNRTVVDADFVIVVGRHGKKLRAENLLAPGLCDADYQKAHPTIKEIDELMWLIGTPFFVRVLEDGEVVCGLAASRAEADRRLP